MMHLDKKILKQKLSDIFSKDRERDKPAEIHKHFDESYFDCKLVYAPMKLSLIKINASIAVGPDAGTPMMINCRWFVKKDDEYMEIESVRSPYYQPCIDDVGCSIHVEIEPMMEGKTYTGTKISKQTAPLELGVTLEAQFMELKNSLYYLDRTVEFSVKVESANLLEGLPPDVSLPCTGCLMLSKQNQLNFDIKISVGDSWTTYYWITNKYPTVEYIRKSYNSIILKLNDNQSMRIVFTEPCDSVTNNREILGLLIRTLVANSSIEENALIDNQAHQDPIEQHSNEDDTQIEQSATDRQSQPQQNSEPLLIQSTQSYQPKSNLHPTSSQTDVCPSPPFHNYQLLESQNKSLKAYIHKQQQTISKLTHQLSRTIKNHNMDKQVRVKLQSKTKQVTQQQQLIAQLQKNNTKLRDQIEAGCDNNRFYKNQIGFLKKQLRESRELVRTVCEQRDILQAKIDHIQKQAQETEILRKSANAAKLSQYQDMLTQCEIEREQSLQEKDRLKAEIQRLQNQLSTANRRIESITMQKSIESLVKLKAPSSPSEHSVVQSPQKMGNKDEEITNLEFKVANLEMLLKYRSSLSDHGNEIIGMHKVINSLTEAVTEKQEQLIQMKKINKQLMNKVVELNKSMKTITS